MKDLSARQQCVVLGCAACFAMLWVVARACVQSITIDEADTYLAFVAPPFPTHWTGSANNQLLNSLLMRLFTSVFGLGHLTARAPALLGAALYIGAAFALSRSIVPEITLQLPLLICLVYNPFIMDHLVAARGYSLALGFLLTGIALAILQPFRWNRSCALVSACAALSFTANFSFAFVDGFLLLWLILQRPRPKAAATCILPGLLIALFLSSSVLVAWPKGQFVYGATSLRETGMGILNASLYELNPYLVNPPLRHFLHQIRIGIFPLLGVACLLRAGFLRRDRPQAVLAASLAGIAAATLAAHWLLFRTAHILLPKDRTAIYFVPLLTLVGGGLIALPAPSRLGRLTFRLALFAFWLTAGYFLLCLRLNYFREWKYDADVKEVYSVVAYYNHTHGLHDIFPNWRYVAALNFYRIMSGKEALPTLESHLPPYTEDHKAYVMYWPDDEEFIKTNRLKVVYRGRITDVVFAIRPEVEGPSAAAASCSAARPGPRSVLCN
jgi:hypothetical protein